MVTYDNIAVLDFGYLNGRDLLRYCPYQNLAKQYQTDPNILINGVYTAYSELIASLTTRYNIQNELLKSGQGSGSGSTSAERSLIVVKIVSSLAIRNILGEFVAISDNMQRQFDWADKTLKEIRNGQISLVDIEVREETAQSGAAIVEINYGYLG